MERPTRPFKRVRALAVPLLIAVGLYWAALYFAQRSMIFPTGVANSRLARGIDQEFESERGGNGRERFWLETDAGKTECWLHLAPDATAEKPAGLIVFSHGNAELIDGQSWVIEGALLLGYSVALCEYRGYGHSDGAPSQAAIIEDHCAMLDALAKRSEIDPERIIYMGRSIGTGVACSLAAERPPAALILIAPFQSIREMAKGFLAPAFLIRDPFDNEKAVAEYPGPVLLLHGTRDEVIPITHSRALERATTRALLIELDSGHNDVPVESMELWSPIAEFLYAPR
jgi:uncharacterized protein